MFPIGLIDRPYKHDQQPLLVDAAGEGSNVLVIGEQGSGKTTALQSLICAAAMTHTPEQVQFYCLALSSAALGTVAGLPHVGGVAYALDEDGIRRTVAEMLELLRKRMRSFPACGVTSTEEFRRRKFGGAPGGGSRRPVRRRVPGHRQLRRTDRRSVDAAQQGASCPPRSRNCQRGRSYGIHVIIAVEQDINLPPRMRGSWSHRVELKLQGPEDAKLLRGRLTERQCPRVSPAAAWWRRTIRDSAPRKRACTR